VDNQKFYLKILAATLSVLAATTALMINLPNRGLIAAALTVAAAALVRSAEKTSRKTGRTERMKAVLEAVRPGAELALISAGLITYSPSTAVTAAAIGLVSFSEIFERSIDETGEFFGQEVRVGLVVLSFIGFGFNQYVLFYGLLAVGLVAAFDSLYMLYRSLDTGF
jgi:hypothetical protein